MRMLTSCLSCAVQRPVQISRHSGIAASRHARAKTDTGLRKRTDGARADPAADEDLNIKLL